MALCSIGPRQMTGWSSGTKYPMERHRTPWADIGMTMSPMLFDLSPLRIVRDAERIRRVVLAEFFASHAATACPSSCRKCFNAVRTQVFTVPRGSPMRAAISVCERPS